MQNGGITIRYLDYLRARGRAGNQRHVTAANAERVRDRHQRGLGSLAIDRPGRDLHHQGAGVFSADARSC